MTDRLEINALTCGEYHRLIRLGYERSDAVGALAARDGVGREAIFKRLRRGGVLAPYKPGSLRGGRRPESEPPHDVQRVDRDPCPRCGVRADVGCNHARVYGLSNVIFGTAL